MDKDNDIIEIIDDIEPDSFNPLSANQTTNMDINTSSFGVSANDDVRPKVEINPEIKKLDDVKYDPIEPEKEEIKIEPELEEDNSKSGLAFVIVLFILLIAFIIALPYISKLF